MNLDFMAVAFTFVYDTPLTFVLVVGAAVLLARRTRHARTLGAVFVGLVVYGVVWRVGLAALSHLLTRSKAGGAPPEDIEALRFAWVSWHDVNTCVDAAAVLVLAWAVPTPRMPKTAATRQPATGEPGA